MNYSASVRCLATMFTWNHGENVGWPIQALASQMHINRAREVFAYILLIIYSDGLTHFGPERYQFCAPEDVHNSISQKRWDGPVWFLGAHLFYSCIIMFAHIVTH